MQKTDIEWADMTWNPVTGCRHNCPYCYARSIAHRFGGYDGYDGERVQFRMVSGVFELNTALQKTGKDGKRRIAPFPLEFAPTFHRYRLDEPSKIKKPKTIFVCSMADLFGAWVDVRAIREVLEACKAAPQHRYLFLTKNPSRYPLLDFLFPKSENFWFGASATDHQSAEFAFRHLPPGWKHNFFLSAEPLLSGMNLAALASLPRWVIIGAMTGPGAAKHQPRRDWISDIVKFADERGLPVFMKDSLIPIVGEENMRRDFPWKE